MANSVDSDQIGAVSTGSTLFASILYTSVMLGNYFTSVMLGNYLQQRTFSDAFFSWRFIRVNYNIISSWRK